MKGVRWIGFLSLMVLIGLVSVDARESGPRAAIVLDAATPSDRSLHWQTALRGFHIQTDFIRRGNLREDTLSGYRFLILPGISTLRATERDHILGFVNSGGGLILTGRAGASREEEGGRSLAEELGLDYREVEMRPGTTAWVTVDRVGRLTAGLPRMQRLSVDPGEDPVALETRDLPYASWFTSDVRGAESAGMASADELPADLMLWPGSGRADVPVRDDALRRSVMHVGERGSGRFVWMAFDPGDVGGDFPSSDAYARLLGNVFATLRGLPTVEVAPWPFPHRQAILFSMDVEERFGNFRNVAEMEDLPSMTYFILSESAGLYDEILGEISRRPERQGRGDISVHGDNHDLFRGQPPEVQDRRLARARDYIENIAVHAPRGFRPPEEAYDFFTLQAFLRNGYRYLLANENPDRAEPLVVDLGNYRFLQLTMLNRDDVEMVVRANQPPPSRVLEEYRRDIRRVFQRGGLYVVNFHSQILATDRYIDVLRQVVEMARKEEAWMVNGLEVYEWWMARDGVILEVLDRTSESMRVRVSQTGESTVDDLAVNIWAPQEADWRWNIETVPEGRRFSRFRSEGQLLTLHLENLSPTRSQTFLIRWRK